jgi:hypothetical protein
MKPVYKFHESIAITTRPKWQEERGPRYGNKRKFLSRIKWIGRKRCRQKEKEYFKEYYET